jgi:hypothetical protein
MPSHQRPKLVAREISHALRVPLENWLILGSRLREIEEVLDRLVSIYAAAGKKRPILDVPAEKGALMRPLYCFAVVTYVRCFGGGRRPPLRIDDVPRLTARNRQAHDEASRLRNKHFAHAVADEEGAQILAIPPQGIHKAGFAVHEVTLSSPNLVGLREFLGLVRKVRRFAKRKEHEVGNVLAKAILGPSSTWTKGLKNGADAINEMHKLTERK